MLFCWGVGSSGQLGLGKRGASEPVPFRRGPAAGPLGRAVAQVACGERHTLLLLDDGSVASCGDNDLGQLGRRLPREQQRSFGPEQIQALEAQTIVHVSCGKEHSLAVCNNGKVFSWGSGEFGQLGTGNFKKLFIPKKIDGLSAFKIIQVACGHYHSIALTKDGRVFSWGQNAYGQLGLGKEISSEAQPRQVSSLDGIPLAQVAAGGAHSFALSLSGVVYGWGRNNAHQLGLRPTNPKAQVFKPHSIAALQNLDVTYISCGDVHTAVLTQNGSVFTFGDNSAEQLGQIPSSAQKTGPQKVDWIDNLVSHLACGSYHTLVYTSATGQFVSFGHGPLTNAGGETPRKAEAIQRVGISALVSPNDLLGIDVKQIFAGTYVNFVSTFPSQVSKYGSGASSLDSLPKIAQMNRELIEKWLSASAESETRQTAKREIEVIFSSPQCLSASFLKPRSALKTGCCIAVDLQKAREVLDQLLKKDWIAGRISFSLLNSFIHALPMNSLHQEAFSSFLLLPECSAALEAQNRQSFGRSFAEAVHGMRARSSDILEKHWSSLPTPCLDTVVQMLKKAVVSFLPYYYHPTICKDLIPILEVLRRIYKVNKKANYKLPLTNFYINEVAQNIFLGEDLLRWNMWVSNHDPAMEVPLSISFCRFPFVFNLDTKLEIFAFQCYCEQQGKKLEANVILQNNRQQGNSEQPKLPLFLLRVQRHNLVEDTLQKLSQAEDSSLRAQLLVDFGGETNEFKGGGVILEYFTYVFDEMVQPEYGMFTYCDQRPPMWFPAQPSAKKKKYFLFGVLLGLALFNRVTAYVPFPLAAFKKLMGKNPCLDDLKELSPVLGRSLQAVLDYECDDIEENLQLCYSISWDNTVVDLIENGSSVAVNNTNKKDFVNKYVDYIFNKSVEGIFEEFKRGFYKVLQPRIVGLFEPEELMEVAIGNANYDWDVYEKNAVYWGIYSPDHPTIKMFWNVFHELTADEKIGFLLFVTGCNRIPLTGMASLKLTIHSHKTLSEDHIPEAYTCTHLLLLPPYSKREKLKDKLLQAIDNNRGFGKK